MEALTWSTFFPLSIFPRGVPLQNCDKSVQKCFTTGENKDSWIKLLELKPSSSLHTRFTLSRNRISLP